MTKRKTIKIAEACCNTDRDRQRFLVRNTPDDYEEELRPFVELVSEVERRAQVRTLHIPSLLTQLRDVLRMIGSKKACEGVSVIWRSSAQKFPSAYKYRPEGTVVCLHYHKDAWIVDSCRRDDVNYAQDIVISFPDDAKAAIMRRLESGDTF